MNTFEGTPEDDQTVRRAAVEEVRAIFGSRLRILRSRDCPQLSVLVGTWLAGGDLNVARPGARRLNDATDIGDPNGYLPRLITFAVFWARMQEREGATGQDLAQANVRNAQREGALGYLFLPSNPEDYESPSSSSGEPRESDLEVVTFKEKSKTVGVFSALLLEQRRRWAALRSLRANGGDSASAG